MDRRALKRLKEEGLRVLLPQPPTGRLPRKVVAWIEQGIAQGVHRRFKCRIRDPWYAVPLGPVPDAFVTCARGGAPKLVLNDSGARCTNTLHAVRWRRAVDGKAIAVGFLSSLTALIAELYGRRYGGGVLKLDPSDVSSLLIPMARISAHEFDHINRMVRAGNEAGARLLADRLTLRKSHCLEEAEYRALCEALSDLVGQRRPNRDHRRAGTSTVS